MHRQRLLKKDLFGEIWLLADGEERAILRDTGGARWWTAPVARWLMRREARALAALDGLDGVPQILECNSRSLTRSFLDGQPLFVAGTAGPAFFRNALRLLRRMHAAGVVHNDLAKEPNILVTGEDDPAFIDFQLASFSSRRGRLFRLAAREDLRHLMKHKRTYRADELTARQHRLLEYPSLPSRIWMRTAKPVYMFVTRRVFGWADREGAADRGRHD